MHACTSKIKAGSSHRSLLFGLLWSVGGQQAAFQPLERRPRWASMSEGPHDVLRKRGNTARSSSGGPDGNEMMSPMASQASLGCLWSPFLGVRLAFETVSGTASSDGNHTSRTTSAMGQHLRRSDVEAVLSNS